MIARDGMVCRHCGTAVVNGGGRNECFAPNYLHFDHVKPWALGGDHSVDNLVVSCATCNLARMKPYRNLRPAGAAEWLVWRGRRPWWPDGFTPPALMAPDNPGIWLLDYIAQHPRRRSLDSVVRQIVAGQIAASGPGQPIAVAWGQGQLGKQQRLVTKRGRRR